jgi:hypothetical protein
MDSGRTGIQLELRFFPLAFLAFFWNAHGLIDDVTHLKSFGLPFRSWGTHFFPVEPGEHTVVVFVPVENHPEGFRASMEVAVEEGRTTRLWYFLSLWAGWRSTLKELRASS